MTPRYWISILICLLLTVQFVSAGTTGKLIGRVTSKETGEPLIGANIMVEGTPLGSAADMDGNYLILQISPGTYSVRFTMIGYQDLVVSGVRIKVDLTTTINGDLPESVVGLDEVVVQAERPMIQLDVTYSQANITSEEVEMLPVEEFVDIIALQAGVVTENGTMHVRGGRGGEISYMVDGITVTDPYNSDIAVEIENNAIQELQFISGTFNAEYGQAMSGIINIITKDGDYSDYSGSISSNMGDYFADDPLFPEVEKVNLNNISDIKANIEGPILPGRISFFGSGRKKTSDGYLFGQRIFYPNSYTWSETSNMFLIDSTVGLGNDFLPADSAWQPLVYQDSLKKLIDTLRAQDAFDWVPMNWSEQIT